MPLLDHFHPPLSGRRHWESFHAQWAACLASALNEELPGEFFAEAQVHASPKIEVDVATWNEPATSTGGATIASRTLPQIAPADLTLPATFPRSSRSWNWSLQGIKIEKNLDVPWR